MEENKRFCRKCHCELSDYSKGKLCDNCRKRRNNLLTNIAKGIGVAAITAGTFVVTAVIKGLGNSNDDATNE